VLELIKSFEEVSGQQLNYQIGDRRAGDVEAVYANNDKARRVIGWQPQYDLNTMMDTAWRWEQVMAREAAGADVETGKAQLN
jgi:UDP-glucose 4-epimerase